MSSASPPSAPLLQSQRSSSSSNSNSKKRTSSSSTGTRIVISTESSLPFEVKGAKIKGNKKGRSANRREKKAGGGASHHADPESTKVGTTEEGDENRSVLPAVPNDHNEVPTADTYKVFDSDYRFVHTVAKEHIVQLPLVSLVITRFVVCRNFSQGNCTKGHACKFVHLDRVLDDFPKQEVHVNYAWQSLENVTYPLLIKHAKNSKVRSLEDDPLEGSHHTQRSETHLLTHSVDSCDEMHHQAAVTIGVVYPSLATKVTGDDDTTVSPQHAALMHPRHDLVSAKLLLHTIGGVAALEKAQSAAVAASLSSPTPPSSATSSAGRSLRHRDALDIDSDPEDEEDEAHHTNEVSRETAETGADGAHNVSGSRGGSSERQSGSSKELGTVSSDDSGESSRRHFHVCKDFYLERLCTKGASCTELHVVHIDSNAKAFQRAPCARWLRRKWLKQHNATMSSATTGKNAKDHPATTTNEIQKDVMLVSVEEGSDNPTSVSLVTGGAGDDDVSSPLSLVVPQASRAPKVLLSTIQNPDDEATPPLADAPRRGSTTVTTDSTCGWTNINSTVGTAVSSSDLSAISWAPPPAQATATTVLHHVVGIAPTHPSATTLSSTAPSASKPPTTQRLSFSSGSDVPSHAGSAGGGSVGQPRRMSSSGSPRPSHNFLPPVVVTTATTSNTPPSHVDPAQGAPAMPSAPFPTVSSPAVSALSPGGGNQQLDFSFNSHHSASPNSGPISLQSSLHSHPHHQPQQHVQHQGHHRSGGGSGNGAGDGHSAASSVRTFDEELNISLISTQDTVSVLKTGTNASGLFASPPQTVSSLQGSFANNSLHAPTDSAHSLYEHVQPPRSGQHQHHQQQHVFWHHAHHQQMQRSSGHPSQQHHRPSNLAYSSSSTSGTGGNTTTTSSHSGMPPGGVSSVGINDSVIVNSSDTTNTTFNSPSNTTAHHMHHHHYHHHHHREVHHSHAPPLRGYGGGGSSSYSSSHSHSHSRGDSTNPSFCTTPIPTAAFNTSQSHNGHNALQMIPGSPMEVHDSGNSSSGVHAGLRRGSGAREEVIVVAQMESANRRTAAHSNTAQSSGLVVEYSGTQSPPVNNDHSLFKPLPLPTHNQGTSLALHGGGSSSSFSGSAQSSPTNAVLAAAISPVESSAAGGAPTSGGGSASSSTSQYVWNPYTRQGINPRQSVALDEKEE